MTPTKPSQAVDKHWSSFLGIPKYKIELTAKRFLYRLLGITLPKLTDQRDYWQHRGEAYMDEILASGYLDREVFFQDMLLDFLSEVKIKSFFEAGCGFGWNIARVKRHFPKAKVGGLDFSQTQLESLKRYAPDLDLHVARGDACKMPFEDNAFDVGFSLGVFMNIHPDRIRDALREMLRVSERYVVHFEYDEHHTTKELQEKRAPKTNIVSHDYAALYEELGAEVVRYESYKDFGDAYHAHARTITSDLDRWEGFEGPEKYVFAVIRVC